MEGNGSEGGEKRPNMDASYLQKSFSKEYFLSPTLLIIREVGDLTNPCIVGSCSFKSNQSLRAWFLMVALSDTVRKQAPLMCHFDLP